MICFTNVSSVKVFFTSQASFIMQLTVCYCYSIYISSTYTQQVTVDVWVFIIFMKECEALSNLLDTSVLQILNSISEKLSPVRNVQVLLISCRFHCCSIPEAEMGRKKWGLIRAAINNKLTTDSSQDLVKLLSTLMGNLQTLNAGDQILKMQNSPKNIQIFHQVQQERIC